MAENRSDDRREDDDENDKDTRREGSGSVKAASDSKKPAKASARAEDTDDDKDADDESDETEESDEAKAQAKPKSAAGSKAVSKSAKKSRAAAGDDEESDEQQDEEAESKPSPKALAAKKDAGKAAAKAPAKPAEPGLMTPTNVALLLAAAGLGAFWKGWDLYRTDGRDFYSGSAWLFVIAFFMVTVSAMHFLGGQLRTKTGDKQKNLLEALVPALPFFALYAVVWWVAWDTWSVMYGKNNHWMWMFFIALAFVSWGLWYSLRPPSEAQAKADELPTRRVLLLLMLPFVTVFGMIWLAERVVAPK